MALRVKGWHKFQHFKDRRPPWIKLYRDLLDDLEWFELDPISAKCLVSIWLIASENDGYLPDLKKLAFRLRMRSQELDRVISSLSHWLEHVDASVISDRYQHDAPETETETETEDMAKTGAADFAPPSQPADANGVQTSLLVGDCPHQAIVALYHELLPSACQVRDWTPSRAAALRARWREDAKRQSLDWWRRFFSYVGESDFLMGRSFTHGRKPFLLDIDWLLKSANFVKVREGRYHEQEVSA